MEKIKALDKKINLELFSMIVNFILETTDKKYLFFKGFLLKYSSKIWNKIFWRIIGKVWRENR